MGTHSWSVTPKEAVEIQKKLRASIDIRPFKDIDSIKTIAGADVSMNRFSDDFYAGIIVLSYPDLVEIEHAVVKMKGGFPYISGLLSFREIPALLEVWEKLKTKPDVVMVDGQGIAHPRRLGIAAHFGLVTGAATLGCAKSLLTGIIDKPEQSGSDLDPKIALKEKPQPGTFSYIRDKYNHEDIIGAAFYSKARSNPLIISPGNKMDLDDALTITRTCLRGYKLPEPTRQAHMLVNKFRRGEIGE